MAGKINLKNISIVLNRPLYSENVGAAARAMRNMGLERLVAVNAKDFDRDKALKNGDTRRLKYCQQYAVFR